MNADVKADVLDAHKPLAVVDAKIDLNTEKLAKVADADVSAVRAYLKPGYRLGL